MQHSNAANRLDRLPIARFHKVMLVALSFAYFFEFADINSFTKISEQILEQPAAIAHFVDRWSAGAVDLLWQHGGVFDKIYAPGK